MFLPLFECLQQKSNGSYWINRDLFMNCRPEA